MASKSKVAILIGSSFDAKGFKQAETSTGKLGAGAKKLGLTLAAAFSVDKIVAFGKESAKAFIEDQAAAARLANVVDNLGLSFANPAIAKYIDNLTIASGVADTELRPAFQALLTTTGSLTNSQKMLSEAIDISKGSGIDLATVSQDLANAYVGNTKGLKKYNLGLTQAELKAAKFEDIQGKLNKQFSGANAEYLETYAGKMGLITNAAGEAQEIIGKGLLDSLALLAGESANIDDLTESFNDFAVSVSNVTLGIATLINKIKDNKVIDALLAFSEGFGGYNIKDVFGYLAKEGEKIANAGSAPVLSEKAQIAAAKAQIAALAAAEAAAKKRAAELAKGTKKNTDELKKQNATKKAGSIFDMTQIQIIAALKGQISKEERDRLELQLALITGNADEITRLTGEIGKAQGLSEKLIAYLQDLPDASNPFAAWEGYLNKIKNQVQAIIDLSAFANNPNLGGSVAAPVIGSVSEGIGTTTAGQAAQLYGGMGPAIGQQPVYVNVQIAGEDVNAIVTGGLQNQSLSGQQAFINRIYGQFGG